MPYTQINLMVDLFLIIILAFVLLPRYPKFTIALFALYLVPWFFPLSVDQPKKAPEPAKVTESAAAKNPGQGKSPAYDLSSGVQVFDPQDSPQEKLSKTQDLYKQVIGILGSATGTAPAGSKSEGTRKKALTLYQPDSIQQANTRLGKALGDLKVDPDAAWFYLRCFWLSAAFFLWIQNYLVGVVALVPSLVPVFYLARGAPLAYEEIRNQPWMKNATKIVSEDQAGQAWLGEYSAVFAALLIALPTFFMILLFWRQMRGVLDRGLKKFMHPDRYQVRFNGTVFDFSKEGKDLVIEGLHFKANRMVQDRKRPEVWHLGSGTELEFIPRGKV